MHLVSAGETIFQNILTRVDITRVFTVIKTAIGYDDIIDQLRLTEEKSKKDELKKKLPFFCGSLFRNNTRSEFHFESAEYCIFDFDCHSEDLALEIKEKLKSSEMVLATFISPSGTGVKVVSRFDKIVTNVDHYRATYRYYLDEFAKIDSSIDRVTIDVSRVCFLSLDADIFINPNHVNLDTSKIVVSELQSPAQFNDGFQEVKPGNENIDIATIQLACQFLSGKISNYSDYLRTGLSLTNLEEEGRELFITACTNPLYPQDTREALNRKYTKLLKDKSRQITLSTLIWTAKKYGFSPPAASADPEAKINLNLFDKVTKYLFKHYDIRYNTLECRIYFKRKDDTELIPLDDYELNTIFIQTQKRGFSIKWDAFNRLLISSAIPRYNPITDYFNSLGEWDGHDYIYDLSETIVTDDNKLFRQSLRLWLIAAVACALSHEVNRLCLILQGGQNQGKTRWFNSLAPAALQRYVFVGNIRDDKDSTLEIVQKFLINLDELEALNRDDYSSIKSIMSKKYYDIRRPYGRVVEKRTRHSSFVGSVNKDDFLSDATGSSRFLCFEAKSVLHKHDIDMNQVWTQALHLFRSNERYWLDEMEGRILSERNMRYSVNSMEEDLLLSKFVAVQSDDFGENFTTYTTTEVAEKIFGDKPFNNSNVRRLGLALGKNNFYRRSERKEHNGKIVNRKVWLLKPLYIPSYQRQDDPI